MRHKHYDFIIAWANGANIEYLSEFGYDKIWVNSKYPVWDDNKEYRIKPEPKPDVVLYAYANNLIEDSYAFVSSAWSLNSLIFLDKKVNIKLTYDGETNELKSVEKI